MAEASYLDQARDRTAFFFESTAHQYEDYLEDEYSQNKTKHPIEWENHYRQMRKAFIASVLYLMQEKGMKQKDMNVGIVGPGFDPVTCELDEHVCDFHLSEFRSIVVIDFSQRIVRSAMDALIKAEVPSEKIFGMQFDITNGLSTIYNKHLAEGLSGVEDEEQLFRFTEQFENFNIDLLRGRLLEEQKRAESQSVKPITETLIGGGVNDRRTMKLTVDGEALPLHLVSYPMVFAGTGAAAEDRFWTTYKEAMSHSEYQRSDEKGVDDAILASRREMFERVFNLIATFNTDITVKALRRVLEDNPDAMVTAVTDISTICKEPRDTFPRLNVNELQTQLACPSDTDGVQIRTSIPRGEWTWADEPEHSHGIKGFEFVVDKGVSKQVEEGETTPVEEVKPDAAEE